jgi:DNA invertase Pin-like site-specific DNA recombinase
LTLSGPKDSPEARGHGSIDGAGQYRHCGPDDCIGPERHRGCWSGDSMMVTAYKPMMRAKGSDAKNAIHELKAKSVSLKATEQPIDTSSAAGKAFLDMLGVFAEFETSLRRERQLEGIAKAKAAGVYAGKGRRRSVDRAAQGGRPHANGNCERAQHQRTSVYRVLGATGDDARAPARQLPI